MPARVVTVTWPCKCRGKFVSLAARELDVRSGRHGKNSNTYACAHVMASTAFKPARQAALERVEAEVARLAPEWAGACSVSRLQTLPCPAQCVLSQQS
jgi:hypothetical protein